MFNASGADIKWEDIPLLARWLGDPANALPCGELEERQAKRAGVYAWHGDDVAIAVMHKVLGPIPTGPLYVGRTNAAVELRLGSRFRSNGKGSTFRCSLAAVLWDELDLYCAEVNTLDGASNARLSSWMLDHLSVAFIPVKDRATATYVEDDVNARLHPPLNLNQGPSQFGGRVRRLRSEHLSVTATDLAWIDHFDVLRKAEASDPGVVVSIRRATGKGSRRSRRTHPASLIPVDRGGA